MSDLASAVGERVLRERMVEEICRSRGTNALGFHQWMYADGSPGSAVITEEVLRAHRPDLFPGFRQTGGSVTGRLTARQPNTQELRRPHRAEDYQPGREARVRGVAERAAQFMAVYGRNPDQQTLSQEFVDYGPWITAMDYGIRPERRTERFPDQELPDEYWVVDEEVVAIRDMTEGQLLTAISLFERVIMPEVWPMNRSARRNMDPLRYFPQYARMIQLIAERHSLQRLERPRGEWVHELRSRGLSYQGVRRRRSG